MKMSCPNLIVYVVTLLCLIHFSSGVRMLREEHYDLFKEKKDETDPDDPNKRFPFPFNFPPLSAETPNTGFNIPFFNMSGFDIPGFGGANNPFNIPGFGSANNPFNIPGFGSANNPFNIPIPGVPIGGTPVPGGDVPVPGAPSGDVPAPGVPSPDVPAPGVPSPNVPAPGVPSPNVPAPGVPSPNVPAPAVAVSPPA